MQNNGAPSDAQQANDDTGETRPQQGGEGGTTRFGMEDGDNTDVPATGLDPDAQSKPQDSAQRRPVAGAAARRTR